MTLLVTVAITLALAAAVYRFFSWREQRARLRPVEAAKAKGKRAVKAGSETQRGRPALPTDSKLGADGEVPAPQTSVLLEAPAVRLPGQSVNPLAIALVAKTGSPTQVEGDGPKLAPSGSTPPEAEIEGPAEPPPAEVPSGDSPVVPVADVAAPAPPPVNKSLPAPSANPLDLALAARATLPSEPVVAGEAIDEADESRLAAQ